MTEKILTGIPDSKAEGCDDNKETNFGKNSCMRCRWERNSSRILIGIPEGKADEFV